MPNRLAGKIALVTGIGAAIGRECAMIFAREGLQYSWEEGYVGGIGAELDNLMFMKRTADRLFGPANNRGNGA